MEVTPYRPICQLSSTGCLIGSDLQIWVWSASLVLVVTCTSAFSGMSEHPTRSVVLR